MLRWNELSLVKRIFLGIILGVILALSVPKAAGIAMFGSLFISALKAVAPILVLLLVMSAIANHQKGRQTNMKKIIALYGLSTFWQGLPLSGQVLFFR